MKRVSTLLVMFLLLLLAACGAAISDTAVTNPIESVQNENGDTAVASSTETVNSENEDTAVAVTSFTPAQNAAEAAQLRPDDHTQGADEPIITIIEYGDFQ